ncbi:MAG TPA: alpha-L-rhamnosidase C-terminal domain-containing protein [Acidobacteriota bacterium]|nr:alpha-L-rhamnosidase C-terminal domain-containing protein [Acidobacteriota bacterium]
MKRLIRVIGALTVLMMWLPLGLASRASLDDPFADSTWIWLSDPPRQRDLFVYFRKDFQLPAVPDDFRLRITADSFYLLTVNGHTVGRGPARSDPRWKPYDEYGQEAARHLRPGRNLIAVKVHWLGEGHFSYIPGRPGLLVEASGTPEGNPWRLNSDASWKVRPSRNHLDSSRRINQQLGFNEVYDATADPSEKRWAQPALDHSSWPPALAVGPPRRPPFERLLPREIPLETDEIVTATGAVAWGRVIPTLQETVIDLARLGSAPAVGGAGPETAPGRLVYLYSRLHSDQDRTVTLTLESDRDLDLWVGGRRVLRHRPRETGGASATAQADLSRGWNRLLVKAVAGTSLAISWRDPDPIRFRSGGPDSPSWVFAGPYPLRLKTKILGMFPIWKDFDQAYPPQKSYLAGDLDLGGWQDAAAFTRKIESIARVMRASLHEAAGSDKISQQGEGEWLIRAHQDEILYLVFDLGREVNGYPILALESPGPGVVEVGYSEHLDGNSLNPYRAASHYADRYRAAAGSNHWELFEKRAFRYLQVELREFQGPVRLRLPALRMATYPLDEQGEFASSDPELNRIWQASFHTLRMSMEDLFIDCPWRERTQWWGDARVQALANYHHSGDPRLVRKGLRDIARSQTAEGITYAAYPTSFEPAVAPEFMALWILSLEEYYRYSGDRGLVEELYPYLLRAMQWFEGHRNQEGLLADLPHLLWVDWAQLDLRGESTALNAYYVEALRRAALLAGLMEDEASAADFRSTAGQVAAAINRRLWDPELGLYRDSRQGRRFSEVVSQQANTLALLFGVAPEERRQAILDKIHDPEREIVQSATPFFSYYVVQTLYQGGRHRDALRQLKRWLKMAETPPGTFWEYWTPHFSRSHGWACAPSILLPQMVLGVQMRRAVFAQFEVRPHHWDVLDWARGKVPLSDGGEISVSWTREKDSFSLRLASPAGKRPSVFLPDLYSSFRLQIYRESDQGLRLLDLPWQRRQGRISIQLPEGGRYFFRLLPEEGS